MRIVSGSGNRRTTFEFPCAEIVNRSSDEEQAQGLNLLINLTGVGSVDDTPNWIVTYSEFGKREKYFTKPVSYANANKILAAFKQQARVLKKNLFSLSPRVEHARSVH